MSVPAIRAAYTARAADYISHFSRIEVAARQDREQLVTWARGVDGGILDVGCGPGQWANHLSEHGVRVEGIDPVPAFIDEARRRYPDVSYRVGQADRLGVDDASLGGVLAWYSLIHTDPAEIGGLLAEFARCVRPGGGLALGFFEGPELAPFDHAVTTAYFWPMHRLAAEVERAGFAVVDTHARTDPGARRHGAIVAERSA